MRNTVKFFGLIAMAAVLFSCEKKIDPVTPTPKDSEEQVTDRPEYNPGEYLVSFGATIESPETKAEIDFDDTPGKAKVAFKENDKVLVVSGDETATYYFNGTEFIPTESPLAFGENGMSVYYPAAEFSISESTVTFTMPDAVVDLEDLGKKAPMAAEIVKNEEGFKANFKNLCAVLQVNVTGARTLNALMLSNIGPDLGEEAAFTIGWNESKPTMAATGKSKQNMTISDLSEALSDTAKEYYFILPAGIAYDDLRVQATLATADAGGMQVFAVERGDWTPTRNQFYQMSFYAGLFSGGTGNEEDPYKIANARDFKSISKYGKLGHGSLSADSFLGAFYKQTADINFKNADLSASMIGAASTPFTGTYDGDNKTLSNFTITGSPSGNEGVAPFKAVDGATLKNIAISNATVTGGKFTAGLVGYAKGAGTTIQNCSIASSTISGNTDYGAGGLIGGIYGGIVTTCSGTDLTISSSVANEQRFGGIICYINGDVTVSECSLNGITTVTGAQKFGGIVAQINKESVNITTCHNHSTINGDNNYMGGICGEATLGTISGCTNDGTITAVNSAGGIVALLAGATVTKCENAGDINTTNSYAGGVVAYFTKGLINNSRSDATIVASTNCAGGLIGAITGNNGTKVNSCFAKGNVKGTNQVGGFVGNIQTDGAYIVNSLAAANVVATGKEGNQAAGGFVGYIKNSTNGKNAWIGNCAVYDVIVKAPNQTSNTSPVRVGGFVGVHNKTTSPANSKIQNCYYQGVAENLGYGGGDDFTTKPTKINGGYHGGIAGYSVAALLDCYSTPKVKANGSGGTYTNNTTLSQDFIYGNTNSNPAITTSTTISIAANTVTLGGVLNAVDETYSSMAFSDWDSYEEDGKYYYYPASLTALGEDFYKK